jgi:cell division initiation protein
MSPRAIRNATFSHRMRGLDEQEVRAFLETLATQIEEADAERAKLRAEVERLRAERDARTESTGEINAHAVALFSQAQQVADRLVAEAVQHARDLMANARRQQREILQRAHEAAQKAAQRSDAAAEKVEAGGYQRPIPEIEYVRTFARVAQVQLKSVLDALAEEVEKLGDLPRMPAPQQQQPSPPPQQQLAQISDVSWSVSVGASATTATTTSPFDPR